MNKPKYQPIWSAYENEGDYGPYLSIKNMTDKPITIEPGESIKLNKTKEEFLKKNPKIPLYSKSKKVVEDDISDDLPF